MTYRQGDIVVVQFPFTDMSQTKKRPALILSNDFVNSTGDYLMVQITSQVKIDSFSVRITPDDFVDRQLPLTSFVRFHKVFLLNESLILSRFGSVQPAFHEDVLTHLIGLLR